MEQHELTLWQQPGVVPAFIVICAIILFLIKCVFDANDAMVKMEEEKRVQDVVNRLKLDEHEEHLS